MTKMTLAQLQTRLAALGHYAGRIDGQWGPLTRSGILVALTDGPDYPLTQADVDQAAADLGNGVTAAHVWTCWDVESTGDPFIDGRPTILPEPHRFSRSTGHRFDGSHPAISSRTWNRALYPRSQAGRWDMLLSMVRLDVDAGFMSASYGGFQILGENHLLCDAPTPWAFAWRQSRTAGDQLHAFAQFVKNAGLARKLGQCRPGDAESCVPFVSRYNGTGFKKNDYHNRFARGLTRRMAQAG